MHLFVFIIRIFNDARAPERQIPLLCLASNQLFCQKPCYYYTKKKFMF